MADDSEAPARHKTLKIHRFTIGLNVLVQFLLVAFIVLLVNYLAFGHYRRWDFSRDKKYALADQTKRVLKTLKKKIEVIVFLTSDSPIFPDVTSLLKEYQYSGKKRIEVEYVDPYRNVNRARDLVQKYKIGRGNEAFVVIDSGTKHKLVNEGDMMEVDTRGMQFGQPAQVTAFKGEQVLTNAIMEVAEEKQSKLYFVRGQGQSPLGGIRTYIEQLNVKVEDLSLANVDAVPEDASAILMSGLTYDLSEREAKLLQDYFQKNGRLFVLQSPIATVPHLQGFLSMVGVKLQNDNVLRTVNLGVATGVVRQVAANFVGVTPIAKRLRDVQLVFDGRTQSLGIEFPRQPPQNIRTEPLIDADKGYWGETEYKEGESVAFDETKDHAAPVHIALTVEKGALNDERVQVNSGRIVVVGNSDFITDESLTQANLDFFIGSLNWLLAREDLIAIQPKMNRMASVNLTDEQIRKLRLLVLGGGLIDLPFPGSFPLTKWVPILAWLPFPGAVPAFALLLGVAVWWRRRN